MPLRILQGNKVLNILGLVFAHSGGCLLLHIACLPV